MVGTTKSCFSVKSCACSAARMILELFGRMMTDFAQTFFTASAISAVLGFIVCPPVTIWSTPKSLKILESPSPEETATIPTCFISAARFSCSSRFCCTMFSILILFNSPNSRAYCRAVPGVLVCTCTLMSSGSPTTTRESPMAASLFLRASTAFSSASGLRF